ncbi:heavy-metal-associated domain-containing protein [Rufibacter aurantiacus]|uniref:heavy-metal-associated domain-containing protein n=1 Tax=Rufibacter aurantiacus TaxID=2817374 RepID=UPI001B317A25|nr:copper chaperone [Rufibacter aurantiacus]
MEILKFKTNVSDQDGIAKVSPFLDKVKEIENWKIDTQTQENILSISGSGLDPQKVQNALEDAGYQAELLRILGVDGSEL